MQPIVYLGEYSVQTDHGLMCYWWWRIGRAFTAVEVSMTTGKVTISLLDEQGQVLGERRLSNRANWRIILDALVTLVEGQ